jgi:3-carboxy-cis,cis-muconate cycloisomerase
VTDLFWPGSERAGSLLSDRTLLGAMITVEAAWLGSLVEAGIAPTEAAHPLAGIVGDADLPELASGAEAGGNPVIGLVALLRDRLPGETGRWLHRGLTSQDVLDTALVLCLADTADRIAAEHRAQIAVLFDLAETHATTPMVGRTLTQHAVPITFGLKAAVWLTGILDATEALGHARARLPAQIGGAAGTLAALVELARLSGRPDPETTAQQIVAETAGRLGLPVRAPWHTVRSPLTALADALVGCTDAYGHLATDVATLSRPEIGELAEHNGGGSSTMPHKHNPALSVLIRRTALTAPGLAATAHLASASTVDERPDGAWHAEWAALRDLGRRAVVAASQASDLLTGLQVDTDAMAVNLDAAHGVTAEQASIAALAGAEPSATYLGLAGTVIEQTVARGRRLLSTGQEAW